MAFYCLEGGPMLPVKTPLLELNRTQ